VSDYVTIERAGNEAIADLIRQRLDEAGIPSLVAQGDLGALAGYASSYVISVPTERAEEARALLHDG
jgi:hypothetical protein